MIDENYTKFAKFYDYQYSSVKFQEFYLSYFIFVRRICEELKINAQNILEIACGTGNLAKIFLDNGYEIEGLDISQKMLDVAKDKGIKVHLQDMLEFNLEQKYDIILCIFDSLNYILNTSDLTKCLKCVEKHLTASGLFIFDLNSDYKINNIVPNFTTQYGKYVNDHYIWLNSHEEDKWISELIYFEKQKSGLYKKYKEKHIEKAFKLDNVIKGIKNSGLTVKSIFSDLNLMKIQPTSSRWFFITQKL
jgi:ubiquinone/menaquinone biosynthesis C-methylase UbiE